LGSKRINFEEEMVVRRVSLILLSLFGLGAGCAQFAKLDVKPSGCINPASSVCPSGGSAADSRILELRLYQLKELVAPCKLDINAFVEGPDKDLDLLKSALVEVKDKAVVRQIEQIEASKSRPLAKWRLQSDTKYVLAVAIGRTRGKNTIRILSRDRVAQGTAIYVHGTNLCFDNSCENSMEEQCP
jgi:hypothetical protein